LIADSEASGFSDADLSPFFKDADTNSNRAQKRHTTQLRYQLFLLIIAAIAGVFTFRWRHHGADFAGVIGAVAFGTAIFIRLFAEQQGDEREWYESRAAAESAKTLCWRFAVAGNPFPESMSDKDSKRLLISRFNDIGHELKYTAVSDSDDGEVTPAMISLRHVQRTRRIRTYNKGRIQAQQTWYATKSAWNERRARTWLKVILSAEALGLIGAVIKATAVTDIDLLGVFAALATAAGAWLEMKRHHTLATAYNVTARELRQVSTLVDEHMSAEEWANFVDQAEEAISREHTMWVASRTGRRLESK
jgi:SMODS and SLOG-associating 2TM effector domain 3/SMODS and SLOG-associating 2TM effector domain 1